MADEEKSNEASTPSEEEPESRLQVRLEDSEAGPDEPEKTRPEPPRTFWWRGLLMIVAVIFAFSIIRNIANEQQPDTAGQTEVSAIASTIPEEAASALSEEEIIVEEAPTEPPVDDTFSPPGYYAYPPYSYYPQPGAGGAYGQPAYPMTPPGNYGYPPHYGYPPSYRYPQYYYRGPYYNPWYPPYPGGSAPQQ